MEEKKFCVYKHTSPSGKVYIGITSRDPQKRWRNGKGYEVGIYFRKAIDKYGWDNIQHEILETGLTEGEASVLEEFYISLYSATDSNYGYNSKSGGFIGGRYTEKVKEKISQRNREYYENHPDKRKEISERMTGKKKSDEARRKMSISKTGKPFAHTVEQNRKIGIGIKAFYEKNQDKKKIHGDRIVKYSMAKRQYVVQLFEDGSFAGMFESARVAEKFTGISNRNILRCCHNGAKHAGGYRWQFAIDYNSVRENAI